MPVAGWLFVGLLAWCSAVSAGDAADAFGFDAEVGCHVGVADSVAFVEGADDVLSLFSQPSLEFGDGVEGLGEGLGAFDGFGSGECGELLERPGWSLHDPTLVGTHLKIKSHPLADLMGTH